MELPEGFDTWSLKAKVAFHQGIKYNWRMWARPDQLPPTDHLWDIWLLLAGRGFGKFIPVSTPMPTPTGWTKMGLLSVGDQVFDEAGRPCRILAVYDQGLNPGYRLTFSDGVEIVAGDEHQWVTITAADRKRRNRSGLGIEGWAKKDPILTTELVDTLHTVTTRRDRNHAIPLNGPLDLPLTELPIDPYLLGVWLGDGSTGRSVLTCHVNDLSHYQSRVSDSLVVKSKRDNTLTVSIGVGHSPPFSSRLAALGVLKDKHVPAQYLRASIAQRLALLQGLMDTDGHISISGYAEFTSTRKVLALAVVELIRSLGMRPNLIEGEAKLYGRVTGPKFRITWRPTMPVASLPRKLARINPVGSQAMRTQCRMLVAAERVAPVPMRCITVDSPNSMYLAGEGMVPTHNTRTGAEYIKDVMTNTPQSRVGMIGMTAGAVRDTMLEGESGLLEVTPPHLIRKYNRSLGQITYTNGSRAFSFSGADPEKLRGFQSHFLWLDELCAMQYQRETWDMGIMGLRLGHHPRLIVTTTPKPTPLIVELVNRSRNEPERVRITTGSTFDNAANLPDSTIAALRAKYEGTTIGRQELYAELILEDPDALWKRPNIDELRIDPKGFNFRHMTNIIVGVDPSMAQKSERESETGIIVVGLGPNGHGYVLEDASLTRPSPDTWARMVVTKYKQYLANKVVAEVNQGYDLVVNTLTTADPTVPVKRVYASRGKMTRAEPVAALYEQKRIHHVGTFPDLEDQMTSWVPGRPSPDRLDALVWALTQLMLGGGIAEFYTGSSGSPIPSVIPRR